MFAGLKRKRRRTELEEIAQARALSADEQDELSALQEDDLFAKRTLARKCTELDPSRRLVDTARHGR